MKSFIQVEKIVNSLRHEHKTVDTAVTVHISVVIHFCDSILKSIMA